MQLWEIQLQLWDIKSQL